MTRDSGRSAEARARRAAERGSVSIAGRTHERLAAWCKANGTNPAAWLTARVDEVAPPARPDPGWCSGSATVLVDVDRRGRAPCPTCHRLIGTTKIGRASKTRQRYRMIRHRHLEVAP